MSETFTASDAKARLLSNVAANVLYLAVATGVGVWQVPYLIAHLGVPAYGQIGVLQAIVNYASLLTFAVTLTVCRFVALRLGRADADGANRYVNTALAALGALTLLLVGAAAGLRFRVPLWIESPPELAADAGLLLVLFMAAACGNALNSPFSSIPFARHRFDLLNLVRALGMVFQVVTLVACFAMGAARLADYGWAVTVKEWTVLALTALVARRLWPGLHLRLTLFRGTAFRDMAAMSLWSTLDRLGYLLYFSIDLVLINAVLGAESCGRYAPLTQLGFLLAMVSLAVAQVFWPIAYEHIARNQVDALLRHARRATRFMSLALALPVGLLCGLAGPGLTVWLGDAAWAAYAPLLAVMIGPLILSFPLRHLFSITHGLNRVRATALITLGGGVLNLALSYALLTRTPLGMTGVAAATGLSLVLRNTVVMPLFTAHVLNRPRTVFLAGLWPGVLSAAALGLAALGLHAVLGLGTLPRLLAGGAALSVLYALSVWAAVLSREDRAFLLSILKGGRRPADGVGGPPMP
jgi:membrane protein EpsK